jgi:hypothetical protein
LVQDEQFDLKIIALSQTQPDGISFNWRRLGSKDDFSTVMANHIDRGVYRVTLPRGEIDTDFEYYIEMFTEGEKTVFPATAPGQNQTVVVVP